MKVKSVVCFQLIVFTVAVITGHFDTMPTWCSLLLSISVTVFALCNFVVSRTEISSLILFAAVFCLLGDLVLSNTIPGGLPVGMLLFALAHVIFITAFIKDIKALNSRIVTKGFLFFCIAYYILMFIMWFFFMRNSDFIVSVGSLIYGLLISTMAAFTIPLYQADKNKLFAAVGSFSFIISDTFAGIAQNVIFRGYNLIIWSTYIFGLFSIVYSMAKPNARSEG